IITALLPDVLVKGGDWAPDQVVGGREVEAAGGRVVIIPYREGKSTTEMVARIVSKDRKDTKG
ncbi:MAG: D-glycero-beta-D-manno-heptose 1-phosphate adenylyltransferase, partial [Candidatus Aminicenantes bacterium]|nr:D-glycero-beta-D-manno-heptose 1-phosphate adenylyltransferase [Candidatus Aminicenantes bacterium]